MTQKIAILGAGSWGTALAHAFSDHKDGLVLWNYEPTLLEEIREQGENPKYLPGTKLSSEIHLTTDIADAFSDETKWIIVAIPSFAIRETAEKIRPHLKEHHFLISATKGLDFETGKTMSALLGDLLFDGNEERVGAISGPTFAVEVAQHLPSAAIIAAKREEDVTELQSTLTRPYLRLYGNTDLLGVELGGALKNIAAIAAGICEGLEMGNNAKAALVNRSAVEIQRIGVRLGADAQTFLGLSGMGDLVLTCYGPMSRNRQVGVRLGKGDEIQTIIETLGQVSEGYYTTKAAKKLADEHSIDSPIIDEVYDILYSGKPPRDALHALMNRELKLEFD